MKKLTLTIYATILTGFSAFAAPSTSPDRDIEILREEIQRQELILTVLKEKLYKLENEVVVDRIRIEIDQDGLKFENETVSQAELKKKIGAMPSDVSVAIVADKATPYRKVTAVLDLLKEHGIADLAFSASNSDELVNARSPAGKPENHLRD